MVTIEADGRIAFTVECAGATTVELVGMFAGWHEQRYLMRRVGAERWHLVIDPGPGDHLFRYVIDGRRTQIDRSGHGIRLAGDGSRWSRVWRPPTEYTPDALVA